MNDKYEKLLEEAKHDLDRLGTTLEQRNADLLNVISEKDMQWNELRKSNEFLSEAIDEAIKDRDYYEKRHKEINIELGIRESEVQRRIGEVNRLEQQNAALQKEVANRAHFEQSLRQERNELKVELTNLLPIKQWRGKLNVENNRLRAKLRDTESTLDIETNLRRSIEDVRDDLGKRVSQAEMERDELYGKNDLLCKVIDELRLAHETAKAAYHDAIRLQQLAQADVNELRAKLEAMTTDRNGYGDMVQELEAKLERAREALTHIEWSNDHCLVEAVKNALAAIEGE